MPVGLVIHRLSTVASAPHLTGRYRLSTALNNDPTESKDTGTYRLTECSNDVIIYTCSNLEGVDGDCASLVLCCELATRDNSVDNLWIIPVTTGVAFEQQNFQ